MRRQCITLALALAGCGGGSSPGPDPTTPAPVPPPAPAPAEPIGLDSRPSNTTCLGPARTFANGGYALGRNGSIDRFAASADAGSVERYLNLPVTAIGEGGLLAAVFHPGWPVTKEIFVSYTIDSGGFQSRLVITDDSTLPASYTEQILLTVAQPFTNHNGGDLAIGPDGFLYLGIGDGGSSNDPDDNAQNTTLLGNILRLDVIDVIDVAYPTPGYAIPADNPFSANARCGPGANAAACPEIFAWGLRNPWRLSFDSGTDEFWVADVGQNAWEEINRVEGPGGNYGWPCREGANDHLTTRPGCPSGGMIDPVFQYPHTGGGPMPTALDLRHDTPLSQTGACGAVPEQGDLGIADARIIAPGDAAGMPPLASSRIDQDGVTLLSQWIDALGQCP